MKRRTNGDRYGPAMEIINQEQADRYLETLVMETMELDGLSHEDARERERHNLGYYAGYFSADVRARVERLFKCAHPVFGKIAVNGATNSHKKPLGRDLRREEKQKMVLPR